MHVKLIFGALAVGSVIGAFRDRWDIFALCVGVMILVGFMVEVE